MSLNAGLLRTWAKPKKTATAGTRIEQLIPPGPKNKRTKINRMEVATLATQHLLTVMQALAQTTLNADAAGAQAVVVLKVDPGNYSANISGFTPQTANNLIGVGDYLVFETPDHAFSFLKVHASTAPVTNSDGTVTVTLASNVPTGGFKKGAVCWFLGALTDTNPRTGEAHPTYDLFASTTNVLPNSGGSVAESPGVYEPLLYSIDNATNVSTVQRCEGEYGG